MTGDASRPLPADDRSPGDGLPPTIAELDLRILTPGLDDEEVAAVISVVAAAVEAQRTTSADGRASAVAASARRWRRSLGPLADAPPFPGTR